MTIKFTGVRWTPEDVGGDEGRAGRGDRQAEGARERALQSWGHVQAVATQNRQVSFRFLFEQQRQKILTHLPQIWTDVYVDVRKFRIYSSFVYYNGQFTASSFWGCTHTVVNYDNFMINFNYQI